MIDSHHHFWWTGRHTYMWPAPVADRLARDFTPENLRPELEYAWLAPVWREDFTGIARGMAAGL